MFSWEHFRHSLHLICAGFFVSSNHRLAWVSVWWIQFRQKSKTPQIVCHQHSGDVSLWEYKSIFKQMHSVKKRNSEEKWSDFKGRNKSYCQSACKLHLLIRKCKIHSMESYTQSLHVPLSTHSPRWAHRNKMKSATKARSTGGGGSSETPNSSK